jgi:iron only hydrogenase large subunit-like protein
MRALQRVDAAARIRRSHENPFVERLYAEVLGEPLGEASHRLLHTHYRRREAP